jgi:intein-encoded DNA endonuclease-like protein
MHQSKQYIVDGLKMSSEPFNAVRAYLMRKQQRVRYCPNSVSIMQKSEDYLEAVPNVPAHLNV